MKHILLIFSLMASINLAFAQRGNQAAFYETSDPFDMKHAGIFPRPGELFFQFHTEEDPQELKSWGFIWLPDNPEGFFVSYLVNNTDTLFEAERQDGSLMMIQEAQDKKGEWRPIEYWVYSGCGNSYFNPLRLSPGQCILVPIRKYAGNFKTQIRLKFKFGEQVLYSKPFAGSISKSQFQKEEDPVHGILYRGPASYFENP